MYDIVVYIGRFQPFHDGHQVTLNRALAQGKYVIMGIGSSNRSRSTENPFIFTERESMITKSLSHADAMRTFFVPLSDYPYNDAAWLTHVSSSINKKIEELNISKPRIALIGFKKDESSRYLDMFPQWDLIEMTDQHGIMSATHVRDLYFKRTTVISEFVPDSVHDFLKRFAVTADYKWLLNEFEYIREYPKQWGKGPFITADPIVVQMGHILLVTRKECPFKGKLAIPGGFVNLNEWIHKARIRELKEETRLADNYGEMPPSKIASFLTKEKVYDDPKRSARGRVITFAGLYKLPSAKALYSVMGDDDAESAEWYNLSDLDASMFMEDHYFIIQDMLGMTNGI